MATSDRPMGGDLGRVNSLLIAATSNRESLSTSLAETLSARAGIAPTHDSLQLFDYIDLEALDRLHEHTQRHGKADWTLEFDVGDETVEVHSNGFIQFKP